MPIRKWQLVGLGLTVMVLLGVLAAGLQTLEFRGGYGHVIPEGGGSPGGVAVFPLLSAVIERLLALIPWFFVGLLIIAVLIFRRKLFGQIPRKQVLVTLVAFLVCLVVIGTMNDRRLNIENQPTEAEQELVNGDPADIWQPEIPPPEPGADDATQTSSEALPWWVTYLVATALAVPLAWLGCSLLRRATRREQTRASKEDLQEIAAQAAAELRGGLAVEEVVIRCWARMADVLATRVEATSASITPRELADFLTRWGVHHQAVAELTTLFEEVRYGHKADAPRRDRALAALAAIEEAYGAA
jgi:hypothetical protein